MKLLPLLLLAACGLAMAATAEDDVARQAKAERDRIKAERNTVQAVFAQEEKACYARFAVTQCLDRAKSRRNEALADLRRQELLLNESERKRKATERQREIDERNSAEKQQAAAERRAKALAEQKEREDRVAEKRARREAQLQEARPQERKADAPKTMEPGEAARKRHDYEERLRETGERKARMQERAAQRKKPAASDLPVPP